MKTFGETLRGHRELMGLTLRQVEEAVGISNAYLSQLENDKIKKPSANVFYKLCTLYNVPIDSLLLVAGIIQEVQYFRSKMLEDQIKAHNISVEEEALLLEYLEFLRFKKRNP